MAVLTLDKKPFNVKPIPAKSAAAFAKVIRSEMGLEFIPMAVWYCDRKPGMKKLPATVDLKPLVFFNGTSATGKKDKGKEARNKAGVLKYLGVTSTKGLSDVVAKTIGKAKVKVPTEIIKFMIPARTRIVFGLYVYRKYFTVTVPAGPTKRAHFVLGLPYAIEWGSWEVGLCGDYITEEQRKGPNGMETVPLPEPKFVPGPYKKYATAIYQPFHEKGVKGARMPTFRPVFNEILSPTTSWRALRHLPKRIITPPAAFMREMTTEEEAAAEGLNKALDKGADGKAVLKKFG